MDFELSPEQEQLRDNIARLMKDRYGFEARKTYQASPRGWSDALWRDYAEMGLLGAPFAEADGGFGGGAVETMIVMEQFGKVLALEPYLQTVVLCGALLKHGASDAQRAELIGAIAAGELKLSFAHMERQSGYDLADVGLSAVKERRRIRAERRKDPGRSGRQRRQVHCLRPREGRAPRPGRRRPLPRRRQCRGGDPPRLSDPGRPAGGGDRLRWRPGRAG